MDIFSAYEILKNDYQYTVLRLYPINVTDPNEQDNILKNILQIFPETYKKEKESIKNKTFTEIEVLKKYLEILTHILIETDLNNKEILLYDIKRVQMINSVSAIDEVIKKVLESVYNKGSIEEKRKIYKIIIPIARHIKIFIFPPWAVTGYITIQNIFSIIKILF